MVLYNFKYIFNLVTMKLQLFMIGSQPYNFNIDPFTSVHFLPSVVHFQSHLPPTPNLLLQEIFTKNYFCTVIYRVIYCGLQGFIHNDSPVFSTTSFSWLNASLYHRWCLLSDIVPAPLSSMFPTKDQFSYSLIQFFGGIYYNTILFLDILHVRKIIQCQFLSL